MKTKGFKVLKIYVENGEVLYDIAIFGENSLIVENMQLCEDIYKKVPIIVKQEIEAEYEMELSHNFINDMLIIH